MTGIGIGLAFGAYVLGIWGYCLVRGYNVPFTGMFGQTWPSPAVNTTILPTGQAIV